MDLIKFLEKHESNPIFLTLLKKGVIPISILDRKVYYLFYLEQRKTFSKMQSVENTCHEFEISIGTVYNSIKIMKS